MSGIVNKVHAANLARHVDQDFVIQWEQMEGMEGVSTTHTPLHVVLSVDVVCFRTCETNLQVLLTRRGAASDFPGRLALPGATVQLNESLDVAAHRILKERGSLTLSPRVPLMQLYAFWDRGRDLRDPAVSIAYYCLVPDPSLLSRFAETDEDDFAISAKDGAERIFWKPVSEIAGEELAFDHQDIIAFAQERLKAVLVDTQLAFHVLPERFTMAELRAIHAAVGTGIDLNASNFTRFVQARWEVALAAPVTERSLVRHSQAGGRPARLYRYTGTLSNPPVPRPTLRGSLAPDP